MELKFTGNVLLLCYNGNKTAAKAFTYGVLRTVCRKDRLTVYKIEKIDFLKICQNKGLGKLVHKIDLSDRLEVYLFFDDFFFSFCPWKPAKFTPKSALL